MTLREWHYFIGHAASLAWALEHKSEIAADALRDDEAAALRGYDRSPEATPSPHLWRGALPTHLSRGEHEVEVRVQDAWSGPASARIRYRLEDAWP